MDSPRPLPKLTVMLLGGLALAAFLTLARLLFLALFAGPEGAFGPGVARALYLGLKFDLRWAAILLVPLWLLLPPPRDAALPRPGLAAFALVLLLGTYGVLVSVAMVDDRAARPWLLAFLLGSGAFRWAFPGAGLPLRPIRRVWQGYLALAAGFTLLVHAVDLGAFAYIHTRLNGTLLMFLDNPAISLRMVWQSYPVVWGSLGLLLLTALAAWAGLALARRAGPAPATRRVRIAARVAGALLLVAALYGKWSRYPLRWGEAFEAPNNLHAQAALNPVLFFLETRRDMDGGYDLERVRASHALLAGHFGIPAATDAAGLPTLRRRLEPKASLGGTPNVVFIQLESLAAFKTSPFGNPLDPTPTLGRLAREGLLFDAFHVVMENTSRSMFATLFGIADVSSTENATRNPLLVEQETILSQYPDYSKAYFLGGSANWAQIRAVLKNNLPDLQMFEEGAFDRPVVDVWGISDVDLLQEVNLDLRRRKQPFMAYVQTSGNHPPFTIPKHHTAFGQRDPGPEALKKAGFVSAAEFNAVRLMDHALEAFFDAASKEAYFKDTVFVLWSDHGIPRGNLDPRFGDLALAIHHVPFILYAPGRIAPRRDSTVASQLDILPTVASLLGRPVWTQTLGKDLLDPASRERAAAFTFTTFRRPPRLGLIQDGHYLNVEPDGRGRLFRLGEAEPRDRTPEDAARAARMLALADGFHQWSRFLLSHNKPPAEAESRTAARLR
jgi:hypothetical protein